MTLKLVAHWEKANLEMFTWLGRRDRNSLLLLRSCSSHNYKKLKLSINFAEKSRFKVIYDTLMFLGKYLYFSNPLVTLNNRFFVSTIFLGSLLMLAVGRLLENSFSFVSLSFSECLVIFMMKPESIWSLNLLPEVRCTRLCKSNLKDDLMKEELQNLFTN